MRKLFSVILCLCLCVVLPACQNQQSGSKVDDSYLKGIEQGELSTFMDLWNAYYNGNARSCGNPWQTDDFSLVITAKRGSTIDANVIGSENEPYLEVQFSLNQGTIEKYWENNNLLFYIYAYDKDGWTKVWSSDDYYWYFYLQGDDIVGSKENAETRIYEGTEQVAVIIMIDSRTYSALYSVNI